MYNTLYNPQLSLDRINNQIAELEKMKSQIQQPVQPAPITQNFQLAPTNREVIRYASSLDEVNKDIVVGDTPYFSRDMSVVWIKNTKGEVKTYELKEIIEKDEKDLKIELLTAQINEMKGMIENAKSSNANDDEPIENEKSTNVSNVRASKTKQ